MRLKAVVHHVDLFKKKYILDKYLSFIHENNVF